MAGEKGGVLAARFLACAAGGDGFFVIVEMGKMRKSRYVEKPNNSAFI